MKNLNEMKNLKVQIDESLLEILQERFETMSAILNNKEFDFDYFIDMTLKYGTGLYDNPDFLKSVIDQYTTEYKYSDQHIKNVNQVFDLFISLNYPASREKVTACIYHRLVIRFPEVRTAKLFIKDCPSTLSVEKLKSLLDQSGYYFGEIKKWNCYGIQIGIREELDLKRQFINGIEDNYDGELGIRLPIETISYNDLINKSVEKLIIN